MRELAFVKLTHGLGDKADRFPVLTGTFHGMSLGHTVDQPMQINRGVNFLGEQVAFVQQSQASTVQDQQRSRTSVGRVRESPGLATTKHSAGGMRNRELQGVLAFFRQNRL